MEGRQRNAATAAAAAASTVAAVTAVGTAATAARKLSRLGCHDTEKRSTVAAVIAVSIAAVVVVAVAVDRSAADWTRTHVLHMPAVVQATGVAAADIAVVVAAVVIQHSLGCRAASCCCARARTREETASAGSWPAELRTAVDTAAAAD